VLACGGEAPAPSPDPAAAPLAEPAAAPEAAAGSAAPADAKALAALVLDPGREDAARARAAVLLAQLDPRAAAGALERLDPWVLSAVLDHVRSIPFEESEAFFRALLGSRLSPDSVRDAIAALADSGPEATPLLVEVAGRAREPALRATAVDAIAFMPDPGAAPLGLVALPARERSAEVRASLYRLLAQHAGALPAESAGATLLPTALAERDAATRLEACALLAALLRAHSDARLREPFERVMVPWLAREAVGGASRPARLRAVAALGLAGGEPAGEALARLAAAREPEVADAARTALASR